MEIKENARLGRHKKETTARETEREREREREKQGRIANAFQSSFPPFCGAGRATTSGAGGLRGAGVCGGGRVLLAPRDGRAMALPPAFAVHPNNSKQHQQHQQTPR